MNRHRFAYTVSYPPATTVQNFAVTPVKIGTDLWESAVRLTWDATTYGTDVWLEYTIARDGLVLKRITSPTETVFVDYVPTPGVAHAYEVTQTIPGRYRRSHQQSRVRVCHGGARWRGAGEHRCTGNRAYVVALHQ